MHKETIAIHTGNIKDSTGGVVSPIFPATAYEYLDAETPIYPRYFNTPNQAAIIQKLCALEGAADGILFSSGMAAVSAVMLGLLQPGDHVVLLAGLYGGTHAFVTSEFARLGISYTFAAADLESLTAAITERTRMIYVESPTNPLLTIVDLPGLAEEARARGITTVIDNTFASPINQNPIRHGIDLVLHSGTKYLGGHSDVCCGVVLTDADRTAQILSRAIHFGGSLNALTCYLLERSLKTLSLRVERQTQNAGKIAAYLEQHPAVARVYYPGLHSHPSHAVAATQMEGFGAMVSFDLPAISSRDLFLRSLRLITPALSLGGVDTTICAPAVTSHAKMTADDRARFGIGDNLLRLSVGIEHADDLIGDLEQAFQAQ